MRSGLSSGSSMVPSSALTTSLVLGMLSALCGSALADTPAAAERTSAAQRTATAQTNTGARQRPRPQPTGSQRQTTGAQAGRAVKSEEVSFLTDEKVPVAIVGSYTAAIDTRNDSRRAPGVVLVHMYDHDRRSFDPLVAGLHAAGFAVLAIDLRGHGESTEPASLDLREKAEGRDPRTLRDMVKDVQAACQWLRRRPEVDPARMAVVGAGLGGSIGLEYAAKDRSIDGLVILTPLLDEQALDVRASARKYRNRQALFLTAQEEREPADELAKEIPQTRIRIVGPLPQGGHSMTLHGTRMLGQVEGVEKEIADFLLAAVGKPGDKTVVASMIGEVYYEPGSSQANRLSPDNLRTFSSAAEAEARGYRPPKRK